MSSPRVNELIAANAKFAETWSSPFTMTQLREVLDDPVIVLTCMDPRVVPEQFMGPRANIAVFRNAGGRASPDVVRTICTLQSLAYKVQKATVMVVHHTDCGMTFLTDEGIKHDLHNRGVEGGDDTHFGCYTARGLKESVLEDVATLKAETLLKNVEVRGFVLSTESGLLEEL